MSNPFFSNIIDLIAGNRARAAEVETAFNAIEDGFNGVYSYLQRALRGAQAGGVIGELPSAASRANKVLVFDQFGDPTAADPTSALNAVNRAGDTMTGPARGAVTADNDLSFDMAAANNFSCTTTGSGTLTFTNIAAGQSGFIRLTNASNHTISAATSSKIGATTLATISATGTYLLSYFSDDGINVYVVNSGALA